MSSSSDKSGDTPTPPPEKSPVILLLNDLGDTTWRMFVPTVSLLLAGVYIDNQFESKPWGLVAGVVLGACITGFLIKKQLQKV